MRVACSSTRDQRDDAVEIFCPRDERTLPYRNDIYQQRRVSTLPMAETIYRRRALNRLQSASMALDRHGTMRSTKLGDIPLIFAIEFY